MDFGKVKRSAYRYGQRLWAWAQMGQLATALALLCGLPALFFAANPGDASIWWIPAVVIAIVVVGTPFFFFKHANQPVAAMFREGRRRDSLSRFAKGIRWMALGLIGAGAALAVGELSRPVYGLIALLAGTVATWMVVARTRPSKPEIKGDND